MKLLPPQLMTLPKRFWEKVAIPADENGCWEWIASKRQNGYGQYKHGDKIWLTHRLVMSLVEPTPPAGKNWALHSCDNPGCVNPDHLRWGDVQDNVNDMIARGRGKFNNFKPAERRPESYLRGERNTASTLTEVEVRSILSRVYKERQVDLAAEFNTTQANISAIARGKSWRHTPRSIE